MAEETIIYEASGIKITNLRAVFGEKTYAVSNISSVETETTPPNALFSIIIVVVGIIFLTMFLSSLAGRGDTYNALNNKPVAWANLGISVVLIALGALGARSAKASYSVKFATSAGQVSAYTSTDQAEIQNIVNAINDAIIKKG